MTEVREETILGVPVAKIKSRRNLLGTWRYFGRKHEMPCHNRQEFDALNVPDLEVAEYILDCESRKGRDNALKAADEAMSKSDKSKFLEERAERIERGREEHLAKYQEYLKDYDVPTEGDRATLWTLAGIDLALRKNLSAQYAYYEKIDPASIQNKKILSDEVGRLSAELRQLQKMLGIDMPTRIKAEQQATGIDVVREIVDRSAEFITNEMVEVEHCGILHTWLACFFPEAGYDYQTVCPKCSNPIHIHKEKETDVSKLWGGEVEEGTGSALLPEVRVDGDDT